MFQKVIYRGSAPQAQLKGWLRVAAMSLGILAATAAGAPADAGAQACGKNAEACGWDSGFGNNDLDSGVSALATYDDGSGEALYVGGGFLDAGSLRVNYIAQWDGTRWSALANGLRSSAVSLAVYDDGSGEALYAGQPYRYSQGEPFRFISRWDGTAWAHLPVPSEVGTRGTVHALTVHDDGSGEALYAAGSRDDGAHERGWITRWDGTAWTMLPGPSDADASPIYALAVYDDGHGKALYAGGAFTAFDGVTVQGIAKWDGTAWSALSAGVGADGVVRALRVVDDGSGEALVAGGDFTTAGGLLANNVAKWDGVMWSALHGPEDTGTNGEVRSLAVVDDGGGEALVAGGDFITAGGVTVERVAKWDGIAWSALSGPLGPGTNGEVRALAVMEDGSGEVLYAGGDFDAAGGERAISMARWNGSQWSELGGAGGQGTDAWVIALEVADDGQGEALFAGGTFTLAGGVTLNAVGRWDHTGWTPLSDPDGLGLGGPGLVNWSPMVRALAADDEAKVLYVGGDFSSAGGGPATCIAKWDGTAWSALDGPAGNGTDGQVAALAMYDDGTGEALYAAGPMDTAGGVTVNHIAQWDGTQWTALTGPGGTGTDDTVHALAVWDDGSGEALYVGGEFRTAGGVEAHQVAKWDGTAWSALSGPSGTGVSGWLAQVNALTVYDDGTGEALFAGGEFSAAGGVPVSNIAKWDGEAWSALNAASGTGINDEVYALAAYDDGAGEALFAGGQFFAVGEVRSWNIARWSCATALYLNQSRFQVDVAWTDAAGNHGTGLPVKLTDEAGYFWFFDEDNVELVVKALDACVDPFDRFWVFAAGLTNVAVTMTVTDTLTQIRRDYENPQGQPFAPILDTDAFATCDGQPAAAPAGELAALREILSNLNHGTFAAVASSGELRLNRNRFWVEVTWSDFAGNSGAGRAVELTDDTGYFWFFSDDNIEVVVKVLDACGDPFNRFWVFAAGLTNVEVTMRVTDTVTGEEKSYHNPLGREFAPILDTDAFATCGAGGRVDSPFITNYKVP